MCFRRYTTHRRKTTDFAVLSSDLSLPIVVSAMDTSPTTVQPTSGSPSSSPALTPEERQEFNDLRQQNRLLKAENAALQLRLEEERAHRLQWQQHGDHFAAEAKMCCDAIESAEKDAPVLALYAELRRLREKCDVYAEAVEESRSYFFEMKRLYTEVEPYLRSAGAAARATPRA